jgi:hypothetical protein
MNQPGATAIDMYTPLTLLDLAAAPVAGVPPKVIWSGCLAALEYMFEPKPNIPLTPSLTATAWPRSVTPLQMAFATGLYVASCPANVTFTVTA